MFDDLRGKQLPAPVDEPGHVPGDTRQLPGAPGAKATAPRTGASTQRTRFYLSVRSKFIIALCVGMLWAAFSFIAARAWLADLSALVGAVPAHLAIFGIAIIPGFMNAFLVVSLLLDRRPDNHASTGPLPGITILVAAYNEEASIASTIESIARQHYPGPMQVIVINDGSTDGTAMVLATLRYPWLQVINLSRNDGKSQALNVGLERARFRLTITVDGDSYLYRNALRNLVGRYLSDPPDTRAVAGAVLVRNSRVNLVTAAQEWDYFHGIAAIKRLQSLYQGTLVAQGAFSVYRHRHDPRARRMAAHGGRGHRTHLEPAGTRLPRRLRRERLRLHECADNLDAVRTPAPALVTRPDRGLQGPLAPALQAADDDAVHLVEPALPVHGPRVHAGLRAGHRAGAVRHLLDRWAR